jgi:ABC-2 type transport system permease protein
VSATPTAAAIGVLGVLVISGEYSTGMIRSSFMAVPRRLPILWAKLLVFSAVTFALMLVSTVISFYAVQAIVTQHHQQVGLGAPHALRAIVGTALFLDSSHHLAPWAGITVFTVYALIVVIVAAFGLLRRDA